MESEHDSDHTRPLHPQPAKGKFFIQKLSPSGEKQTQFIKFYNVTITNTSCVIIMQRRMLSAGTQETLLQNAHRANWTLPSVRTMHALFSTMHKHSEGEQYGVIESIRRMFAEDLRRTAAMTSTMVQNNGENGFLVMNAERGTGISSQEDWELTRHGWESVADVARCVTGCHELASLQKVYTWLTGGALHVLNGSFRNEGDAQRPVLIGTNPLEAKREQGPFNYVISCHAKAITGPAYAIRIARMAR